MWKEKYQEVQLHQSKPRGTEEARILDCRSTWVSHSIWKDIFPTFNQDGRRLVEYYGTVLWSHLPLLHISRLSTNANTRGVLPAFWFVRYIRYLLHWRKNTTLTEYFFKEQLSNLSLSLSRWNIYIWNNIFKRTNFCILSTYHLKI